MTRFRKALVPLVLACASAPAHSQIEMPHESAVQRYADIIDAASRAHGVDGALVHAVIFAESSYDPRAVSPQGATGLMQLMPDTARQYGVRNALDPAQNIGGGVRMLRELLDRFDQNVELALAAYNAGPNAVLRAGGRIPAYGETRNYVPRVLGYYRAFLAMEEPEPPAPPSLALPGLESVFRAAGSLPVAAEPEGTEHGKRLVAISATRRTRRWHAARIFGSGASTLFSRTPEAATRAPTASKRSAAARPRRTVQPRRPK